MRAKLSTANKFLIAFPMRSMSLVANVKRLRSDTGSPIGECKKALQKFDGNFEKAKEFLREQGAAYADR